MCHIGNFSPEFVDIGTNARGRDKVTLRLGDAVNQVVPHQQHGIDHIVEFKQRLAHYHSSPTLSNGAVFRLPGIVPNDLLAIQDLGQMISARSDRY